MTARSVNKVVLVGRLGADPDVRSLPSGGKICRLNVATWEQWRDRNTGEAKKKTEWHVVEVHHIAAIKFAEMYLTKGRLIYVEGKLETRKWQDKSGQYRYTTSVVVRPYVGDLIAVDRRSDEHGRWPPTRPFTQPATVTEFVEDRSIGLGTTVTIKDDNTGDLSTYQIVPETRANIEKGSISSDAPLAHALIGHEVDDVVVVEAPGGIRSYTIIEAKYVG